ncbi:MAG: ATP-binding cassette domain-containing protein [Candidatus Competibacteraceae bacterium]|nr:ATP-binding cassette domain-containing protein [Candidatus Competibacteraceae bacterium]
MPDNASASPDLQPKRVPPLRPLRGLLPFLKPYTRTIILALAALLLAAAATLSMPVAVRFVIDSGIAAQGTDSINRYFLALFALASLLALFSAVRFYLVSWLGERVVADIRAAVFRHILSLSPTFFEVTRSGEVLSRLTTDTTLIQSVVGSSLSVALRSLITLLGALLMLAVTSPRLTAIIILLIPLGVLPIILVGRRVRRLSRASQDRIATTSAVAGEVLGAIQIIQAFTLEALQAERFGTSVEEAFQTARQRIRTRALLTVFAILVVFGGIVFVLWIGAQDVIAGRMSGGELGQFLLYAIFVGGSSAGLSEIWGEIQRAAGATERLMELLQARPDVEIPAHALALPEPAQGQIAFEHIVFNYPSRPEQAALHDFSLSIKAGETVALVGPSGAGKSTVFQLLLRFYQPGAGRILLDGVDIAQALPDAVRSRIGIVPQDTVLFADTILENIRYGRPGASDNEVRAAARAAAADEFIERLPQGYATFVGERGVRLSGGQQQRLAIARAILKKPAILLLDEATSALDAESETLVQQALAGLMRERTTLVIAHRLATVLNADRIVVMEQGRIVASGKHAELMAQNGLYTRLAELQFRQDTLTANNSRI